MVKKDKNESQSRCPKWSSSFRSCWLSSVLEAFMVLTILQSSLPQQMQNSEQDRQAEEQLHCAKEQGHDEAQSQFIIFSMSTGSSDTSGGPCVHVHSILECIQIRWL